MYLRAQRYRDTQIKKHRSWYASWTGRGSDVKQVSIIDSRALWRSPPAGTLAHKRHELKRETERQLGEVAE